MKGHVSATDEEIREAYQKMSKREICKKMSVGIHRVRSVIRGSVPA